MVLVDSNVIIDHIRKTQPKLLGLFKTIDPQIPGAIRAEVLTGARTIHQFQRLTTILDAFGQLPTPESLWDETGLNRSALEARGISVPFNDVLISTMAIYYDIELWTRDKHFPMIQTVLTQLKLFQEP